MSSKSNPPDTDQPVRVDVERVSEEESAADDARKRKRFLVAIARESKSLTAIMDDLEMDLRDVARWREDPEFRSEFAQLRRAQGALRTMEFERGAYRGVHTLYLCIIKERGFIHPRHMRHCFEWNKQADAATRRKARKAIREWFHQIAPTRFRGDLAAPQVAHLADRLLEELELSRRKTEKLLREQQREQDGD